MRGAPVRIDAPVVDVVDNQHNVALGPLERLGLTVQRFGWFPAAAHGKMLESEWGLALYIESTIGRESRRYLLDFGFTPMVASACGGSASRHSGKREDQP